MKNLRQWLPDAVAVVLFALVSFAYFFPADTEGRILFQHDSAAGKGLGHEADQYYAQTGERTRWTNAAFSGMPTFQTAPAYDSQDGLNAVMKAYHLWLPEYVWYVFVYLLGFYIMLRAFDYRHYLAMLGAVAWAFSSYFFIIISAGHIWKVWALAYLPPMLAGIVLAYRGRFLWGLVLTSLFAAFEVKANHVQMTYYYLFIVFFLVLAFLYEAVRQGHLARFLKATAVCLAGAAIGIGMNISNLYHTWQYQKESMRGKSELVKANAANQTSSGLERDYITQWSYGIDETWTLLIPNAKGGASIPIGNNATAMAHADQEAVDLFQQTFGMNPYQAISQYWGTQPGTSGPVYVGAFVMMLFVLSLFIVRGPVKWALLAATVLSILLSWGKNFMPLTNWFIDYFPMYSKFRTVASILVIAEFTIPMLAVMALRELITPSHNLKRPITHYLGFSFLLTGGLCLLFWLLPDLFFNLDRTPGDMSSVSDITNQVTAALQSYPDMQAQFQGLSSRLLQSLEPMHRAIFRADCLRSFVIILIGAALLLLFKSGRLKANTMTVLLTVLCLADMWMVNKRYLYDAMFVESSVRDADPTLTEADKLILQDKSLDYRVLNLSPNVFNENETSFYHKSIGGYHAAKLRRYQELAEAHMLFSQDGKTKKEMDLLADAVYETQGNLKEVRGDSLFPVLNMLNAKYVLVPLQGGQRLPVENPHAQGNAWFVSKVCYVGTANEELDALHHQDLRHAAVADNTFREVLGESVEQDSVSEVRLTRYAPNELDYEATSHKGGVVVFSEIFYPGWTATIDGEPAQLARANYVLRALRVPAGTHKIRLEFRPVSVEITERIAYTSMAALVVVIAAAAVIGWRRRKE